MMKRTPLLLAAALLLASCATSGPGARPAPLAIQEQGSFAVGGRVITDADGKTFHGDHVYVSYQVPLNARKLPLVLWHGAGQSGRTWETTPDGREGFQNIFLRRGYSVYTIDQPRRGRAGRSTQPLTINPVRDEQSSFDIFRVGIWPNYFEGVQFPRDAASLEQYFRQMTPNAGPYDADANADAVVALLAKTGPAVLVTHSQGGGPGWLAAIRAATSARSFPTSPAAASSFRRDRCPRRCPVPPARSKPAPCPWRISCS